MSRYEQLTPYNVIQDWRQAKQMLPAPVDPELENDFYSGEYSVIYNDNLVAGFRLMPEGQRKGVHVQGYKGRDIKAFARDVVKLAQDLGYSKIWFATKSQKILDQLEDTVNVIEEQRVGNEIVFYVEVPSVK